MRLRFVLLGLTVLLFVAVSFGSFKYGELQGGSANSERDMDKKLAAAFAVQSVKLLLKANEEMTKDVDESREWLVTHLGDSLYFVGMGLARRDSAYLDIAASLCPRLQQISAVMARLPEGKATDDVNVRVNRQSRKKLFAEGLAEIEKHCAARKPQ